MYIGYIVDGYEQPQWFLQSVVAKNTDPDPHWQQLVMGIVNLLFGFFNAKSMDQDSAILAKLRYPAIYEMIWRDLHQLLLPGPQADFLRSTVCHFMAAMASDPSHRRFKYSNVVSR